MAKRNGKPPNLVMNHKSPTSPTTPTIARLKGLDSTGSAPPTPSLNVNRLAYNVSQFNEDFIPIPTTTEEKIRKFKPDVSRNAWIRRLKGLLPISLWLPEYKYKENLLTDIIVGITVAIFQVPQSMGYCLIAHVPPIYGLYSAFFPALFYTLFGTGFHSAFGPFAIVSGVMTGDIVTQVMTQLGKDVEQNNQIKGYSFVGPLAASTSDDFPGLLTIDVAIMVGMIIGIYIFMFGVFQLGFISNFMSEELISGFTTSASVIVFVSQLPYLLGVDYKHFSGPFNLYYTLEEVFTRLEEINFTSLTITGICLAILLFFKLVVNRFTTRTRIKTPFPIELFVVIGGTIVSHVMELRKEPYNVRIVGQIGNNFPTPMSPNWKLFPIMWEKCIATAIVGYTITLSVGKIYGKKHGYKVDPNQEMIAMGAANMISSTFQCIPCAASLPRSALQETAGGKTQVVSVVNCLCIVVVILALGRYLEELPTCVLGSCIAVALVSLITKVGEFRRFWKVSKLDGMIWMITFVFVLVLCVDYGIYIGIVASLLLLIYKSERPKTYLLGTMPELDIYVPINKFNRVEEPKDFKIFQMCGPLNFSNVEYFSTELENKCGFHLTSIQKYMKSKEYKSSYAKVSQNIRYETLPKIQLTRLALNYDTLPKYLVIDCSVFSFIDFSGISTLKKIILTFEDIGIQTVLSGIHVHLESMLAKEGFFTDISTDHLYKTIHDAVVCLQELENESKEDDVFNEFTGKNSPLFMRPIAQNMGANRYTYQSDSSLGSPHPSPKPGARNGFKKDNLFLSLRPKTTTDYGFPNRRLSKTLSAQSSQSRSTPEITTIYPLKANTRDSYIRMDGGLNTTPPNSPRISSAPNIDFLFDFDLPSTPSSHSSQQSLPFSEPVAHTSSHTVPQPLPPIASNLYPTKRNAPKAPAPPPPVRSSTIPVPPPLPPQQIHETPKRSANIPVPPPPPPPAPPQPQKSSPTRSSTIPVPPPLPPEPDYNMSPKSKGKPTQHKHNAVKSAKTNGLSAIPEPKEDYNDSDDSDPVLRSPSKTRFRTNNRVSAKLLARQEMVEKLLENRRNSITSVPTTSLTNARMSDA